MQSVFVSSVINGYEEVRAAAREAIESAGFRAVMAETAGALPLSSKRGLLTLVGSSDIYLLLVSPRYGERGESGWSPTEDEFNEANRLNKRIIVLKQDRAMDEAQAEFLRRVAGRWEEGLFYATFTDARDAAMKVVRALTNVRHLDDLTATLPQAQERAAQLAMGEKRNGSYSGDEKARVAIVPVGGRTILDELLLDEPGLGDRLAASARATGIVAQSLGITAGTSGQGVRLSAGDPRNPAVTVTIGTDGAVTVAGSVAGSEPHFGSAHVDPDRLDGLIASASAFAVAAFDALDGQQDVQQVAVAVSIGRANGRVFGRPKGNSVSFGNSHSLPQTVVAPHPAVVVRRVDLAGDSWRPRVVAAIKRIFADANAVVS